jgi:hypothetical protein
MNSVPHPSGPAARGLLPGEFRCVALNGIGDGGNSYPHGMAWYQGYLYVATTRLVFQLLYYVSHKDTIWNPYPVHVEERNPYEHLDARGQIWRYHPPTNVWEKIRCAELTEPINGIRFPYFTGIRNMIEFQASGESRPALYMPTFAPKGGPPPMILRTENGLDYERLSLTGTSAQRFNSFRPMVNYKGRLWIAPTGKSGAGSAAGTAMVMASDDPARSPWQQCNETNFGDAHNEGIFEMTIFNGYLYAGTVNPDGFQLWKTDGENFPRCRWQRVLAGGGGRGGNNQAVGSMKEFRGALYLGVSIINGGYDRNHGLGPAAAELLRVFPDDTWELVVGEGRITEQGLKLPLSGMSAGFDNPFNTYIWRMGVHDGWLYAGTFSTAGVVQYFSPEKFSERVKRIMDRDRIELLAEKLGGCALWRSRDGKVWLPVTTNGFGNPFNYGIRALITTPHGLFVGTANPFGPDVAVHRASGWQYETNPRGGLEVWLGSASHYDGVENKARPQPPPVVLDRLPDFELDGLNEEERRERYIRRGLQGFYRDLENRTMGYWRKTTRTADAAAAALLEEVDSLLPPNPGHLLELVSGASSASSFWQKRYPKATITSRDLAHGPLTEKNVDAIIDVETLSRLADKTFHLMEVRRALKPGGVLVGAAILHGAVDTAWGAKATPIFDVAGFKELLLSLGFTDVAVTDATRECWLTFSNKLNLHLWEQTIEGSFDGDMVEQAKDLAYGAVRPVHAYVIYRARVSELSPKSS